MVLVTKIEIRIEKESEDSEHKLSAKERTTLKNLGIDVSEEDESRYEYDLAEAIIDFDRELIFYEYEGELIVEKFIGQPLRLKASIDDVQGMYNNIVLNRGDNRDMPYHPGDFKGTFYER